VRDPKAVIKQMSKVNKGLLWKCLRHSFGMSSISQSFLIFRELTNSCSSHGFILSRGLLSTVSSKVSFDVRSYFTTDGQSVSMS
jgi:hypothetical protein